jgi:tetratricopeptide (TPR) repeat protein
MVVRQFIGDLYYRMAYRDGSALDEAIAYLEKCIAIDNDSALFHFSLGRAFLGKGLADPRGLRERNKWVRKSIDELHKAIELEPSHADYHFLLGMSYGYLGYPPPLYWNAIDRSFSRSAGLNPTDVRHLYSMGTYYLGEYVRLRTHSAHYQQYVPLSKRNYERYFRRSLTVKEEYLGKILKRTFSATGDHADLKGIVRETSHDHALLARFLDDRELWEEAQREYWQAVNLEPANPVHYWNLARALFRRRYYEEAIYWWGQQKALDSRDAKPYLFSAHSFMKLKRFDDALRELRDLIRLHPDDINHRIELTRTLLVAGRLAEAIDEYRTIMGIDPRFSETTYDRIRQHQKEGNHPEATRILNDALSLALR